MIEEKRKESNTDLIEGERPPCMQRIVPCYDYEHTKDTISFFAKRKGETKNETKEIKGLTWSLTTVAAKGK